jgi:hypothetical protein
MYYESRKIGKQTVRNIGNALFDEVLNVERLPFVFAGSFVRNLGSIEPLPQRRATVKNFVQTLFGFVQVGI